MLLFYKHFNYESEPTLNQQMPVLNQRQRVEFFPWQAVNQQNAPLNQRKIAEVGSGKPSNGAGWRAVNQLNQLNQHYFCLLSEKKQRLTEREVSMTAQISAYGRLVADPETRTTGKGTSMAMARLAVSLPCNAAADGQATFWLGVIAFGKQVTRWQNTVKAILSAWRAICSIIIGRAMSATSPQAGEVVEPLLEYACMCNV